MALNLRICVSTASHLEALSFSDKKYCSCFRGKRQRGEAAQMVPERTSYFRFRTGTLVGIQDGAVCFCQMMVGKKKKVVRLSSTQFGQHFECPP